MARFGAVCFGDGSEIEARAVLVATGVSYRLLEAPGLAGTDRTGRVLRRDRRATPARARARTCTSSGAANSAGQAVLNLARFARRVVLLVRSDTLEKSMSQYLVERIRATDNIEVRLQTEVGRGRGDGHLEAITIADRSTGVKEEVATNWLFVFIGAAPRTDWLGTTSRATRRASSSPDTICWPGKTSPAGPWHASRSCSRPACPACSRPATCGSTP